MRLAFIVKNPKWEPFIEASDAFKKLGDKDSAVLVVRGRCKEKKVKKAVKVLASILFVLCLFGLTAQAQQSVLSYLPATTVAGASTNSTAGTGVVGWNIDQVAVFQLTCVSTNTCSSAVNVDLDTSDNGTDWVSGSYTVGVTANGTTPVTAITRLTNSVGGKYLRVAAIRNPNAYAITVQRFTLSTKQ